MTVEEFAQMDTADAEDYELVDGEPIQLPSPTPMHARICRKLEHALANYFERTASGESFREIDCRVAEYTVRQPDLSIFLTPVLQQIDLNKVPIPFSPDIAVEVLSPSESATNVNRKIRDFLAAGTREVWLVDNANGELFIHTRSEIRLLLETDILESPLLPGFAIPLSGLLSDL